MADRPMTGTRTELEVASDVVVRLMARGIIANRPEAIKAVCESLGVPSAALRSAWRRQSSAGYRAPVDVPAIAAAPAPRPNPVKDAARGREAAAEQRSRQPRAGDTELTCGRCEESKPLGNFPFRGDRPGQRWTVCDGCRSERARNRYLSVSKEAALAAVRIEFVLSEDDERIGLRCSACHHPIVAGDHVAGLVELVHADCPTPHVLDVPGA